MMINSYGPFRINRYFTFSNFENFGQGHNKCFDKCIELCEKKSCVIDVGAHIGLVTLPASKVINDDGVIYAFEPGSVNRKYLLQHLKVNEISNVKVIDMLVGESDEENIAFYEYHDASGMNSAVNLNNNYSVTQKSQVSLDSFCDKNNLAPDVIKMDIEGYEYFALKGAKNILEKYKPVVVLSYHPRHLKELSVNEEDFINLVHYMNYKIFDINDNVINKLEFNEYILRKS